MEIWDLLDANGEKTGKTVVRGTPLEPGQYHLVVDVWIRNRNGKYLISRRAPGKTLPGMWETTGGSALSGEESLAAALREAQEEVGMTLTPENGKIIHREGRKGMLGPIFLDSWLFIEDIDELAPVCQVEEVCDAKWATRGEILEMIAAGIFVNHLDGNLSQLSN